MLLRMSRLHHSRVDPTYVGRILRFMLLALDIVEMLLDGWQPANLQLADRRNLQACADIRLR